MRVTERYVVWPAIVAILVATFIAGLSIGCGPKRHAAVVADVAIFEVLNDIHAAEQMALCGQPSCATVCTMNVEPPVCSVPSQVPNWTPARSRAFNVKLLPAVEAGRQFNITLRDWNQEQPMPTGLTSLIESLGASLTEITAAFPDGTVKATILANIGKAQQLVLNAVALVLSITGGN